MDAISANTSLTCLELRHSSLGSRDGAVLAQCLRGNTSLTSIDVGANPLGNAAVVAFASGLEGNHTLRVLCVDECLLGVEGVTALVASATTGGCRLRSLRLAKNPLGPKGAAVLNGLLGPGGRLRHLDICNTSLQEEGAAVLAAGLSRNRSLASLRVCCNAVGPTGAEQLSAALGGSSRLQTLDLRDNGIGRNDGGAPDERGGRALRCGLASTYTVHYSAPPVSCALTRRAPMAGRSSNRAPRCGNSTWAPTASRLRRWPRCRSPSSSGSSSAY